MRDESLCGCSCHAVTPERYISLCLAVFLINSKWNCKQMKQFYTKCILRESPAEETSSRGHACDCAAQRHINHNLCLRKVVAMDQNCPSKCVFWFWMRWWWAYDVFHIWHRASDAALCDQVYSCALGVHFYQAFKGWVSVWMDPFCEVSRDISIGGLCDSNKV